MRYINPYGLNLNVIVATSQRPELVIGYQGGLPWNERLVADMRWFSQVTMDHVVIMGRKTWDSIPEKFRPLPGRTNIVLTRKADADLGDGVRVVTSYDHALREAATCVAHQDEPVFVIGGTQLYRIALPDVRRIYVTTVPEGFLKQEVSQAILAADLSELTLFPDPARLAFMTRGVFYEAGLKFEVLDRTPDSAFRVNLV